MKRVQLFEFEDYSWFPAPFRNSMTNVLVTLQKMMGTPKVLGGLVQKALEASGKTQIVDLGSGSGGVMPIVFEEVNTSSPEATLLMTDKHPNPQAIAGFNKGNETRMRYHEQSVDATNLADAPDGLKTMVNSFHHMPPKQAKAILRSAQENGQPILIYEIGENNIPTVIWWILLPISLVITSVMFLFLTPLTKPLTWHHLVFTYLIPVLPLFYAWDGQASLPRMYTMDDIDAMLSEFPSDTYVWEKGRAFDEKGKKKGTYLMGRPSE